MKKINPWISLLIGILILFLPACGPASVPKKVTTPTPTATPTLQPPPAKDTPTPAQQSACEGLEGELEVQLVLPYAAAADLDPIAAGTLSLTIDPETDLVQGHGHISYDETQTWTDEEGKETTEVFLELDLQLEGVCNEGSNGEELQFTLDAVHQEEQGSTTCAYPPGECKDSPVMGPLEQSFDLEFPLEDGYTVEREDWTTWTFVIHLPNQ